MEPSPAGQNIVALWTDFVAPLRHRLRNTLDRHAVLGPDRAEWIEVERKVKDSFFGEAGFAPVFFSPRRVLSGEMLACVETGARPWWLRCSGASLPGDPRLRDVAVRIFDLFCEWLNRLAPLLEKSLEGLRPGPISYRIDFPELERFSWDFNLAQSPFPAPEIEILGEEAIVSCSPEYLGNFASPVNAGDRLAIAALARGAYLLATGPDPDETLLESFVRQVAPSDEARFVHMTPVTTPDEAIYGAIALPEPRFQSPEDRAWSRFRLARAAGWAAPPGADPRQRGPRGSEPSRRRHLAADKEAVVRSRPEKHGRAVVDQRRGDRKRPRELAPHGGRAPRDPRR